VLPDVALMLSKMGIGSDALPPHLMHLAEAIDSASSLVGAASPQEIGLGTESLGGVVQLMRAHARTYSFGDDDAGESELVESINTAISAEQQEEGAGRRRREREAVGGCREEWARATSGWRRKRRKRDGGGECGARRRPAPEGEFTLALMLKTRREGAGVQVALLPCMRLITRTAFNQDHR
jgi:hypothetical protein